MATSECNACGGTLHWDWTEAFAKFGFGDGDGQIETGQVEDVLTEAGYTVTVEGWGLHNTVITSILKDGIEQIPYANADYRFGYDDPRTFFPADLVRLLDEALPPNTRYPYVW